VGAGEQKRVRDAARAKSPAQSGDDLRVAAEVGEGHG